MKICEAIKGIFQSLIQFTPEICIHTGVMKPTDHNGTPFNIAKSAQNPEISELQQKRQHFWQNAEFVDEEIACNFSRSLLYKLGDSFDG